MFRAALSFSLCLLIGTNSFGHEQSSLALVVVAGQGGTNILKPASSVPPSVQVRSASGAPIMGAVVTFSAPMNGPTVKFPNGRRTYSVVTEKDGSATVGSMTPEGEGNFSIEVSASYDDMRTNLRISQANYATLKTAAVSGRGLGSDSIAAPHSGMSRGTKIAIIATVVAVAAGVGTYFALRGGHASGTTVSPGTATVGAP